MEQEVEFSGNNIVNGLREIERKRAFLTELLNALVWAIVRNCDLRRMRRHPESLGSFGGQLFINVASDGEIAAFEIRFMSSGPIILRFVPNSRCSLSIQMLNVLWDHQDLLVEKVLERFQAIRADMNLYANNAPAQ